MARTALTFSLFVLVEILRRPESILNPSFWNEDYPVFYSGEGLLTPYRGYLHLVPRLVGAAEHYVSWPALLGAVAALTISAGVATFIASDRMEALIPSWQGRLAAGAYLIFQPAIGELLGSITYTQWWLGAFLLVVPFAKAGRLATATALAIASLTGPFAIFAAPIYWLKKSPHRMILLLGALAQLAALLLSPRGVALHVPDQLWNIVARRLIIEPIVGHGFALAVPLWVSVPLGFLAIRCVLTLPRSLLLAVAATVFASLALSTETSAELLDPGGAERYFMIPTFVLGLGAIRSVALGRTSGWILIGLMMIGVAADLRLPPH